MTLDLGPDDVPYLPRGVRMTKDRVRGGTVLLAPEKAITLDSIGEAILSRVTGIASFDDIVSDLAATYDAPVDQISGDVQQFMVGLRARVFLMVKS